MQLATKILSTCSRPLRRSYATRVVVSSDGITRTFRDDIQHSSLLIIPPFKISDLRDIVKFEMSNTKDQRIDLVRFEDLNLDVGLNKTTCQALDGLRPRHLELECGYSEQFDLSPLDDLETKWPLESILVSGSCGVNIFSDYMKSISSLTLYYCCNNYFEGPLENLRNLSVIENDAIDTFFQLHKLGIPKLESLKISSTNGCDFTHDIDETDFVQTLRKCSSLRSLDLELEEQEFDKARTSYLKDLPLYFPSNIEHLHFRGPAELADNLSTWLQCLTDLKHMPNLKTLSFCLGVIGKKCGFGPGTPVTTRPTPCVLPFLHELSQRRPGISVIKPQHED